MKKSNTIERRICEAFVTGFWSGYSPVMPGTAGTLAAAVMSYFLISCNPIFASNLVLTAATLILFFLGIRASNKAYDLELFNKREDPGQIVIDEFVGYFASLITLPLLEPNMLVPCLVLAFFWFRFFDILKPPPLKQAEALHGGLGIMLDDLMAGILAMGSCHASLYCYSAFM